jgi:hypothetical protein
LSDGSNWVGVGGETFIDGVLEETATNGKNLAHRASRHFVFCFIDILTVLSSKLAYLFSDLDVKRTPFVVDDEGITNPFCNGDANVDTLNISFYIHQMASRLWD